MRFKRCGPLNARRRGPNGVHGRFKRRTRDRLTIAGWLSKLKRMYLIEKKAGSDRGDVAAFGGRRSERCIDRAGG